MTQVTTTKKITPATELQQQVQIIQEVMKKVMKKEKRRREYTAFVFFLMVNRLGVSTAHRLM